MEFITCCIPTSEFCGFILTQTLVWKMWPHALVNRACLSLRIRVDRPISPVVEDTCGPSYLNDTRVAVATTTNRICCRLELVWTIFTSGFWVFPWTLGKGAETLGENRKQQPREKFTYSKSYNSSIYDDENTRLNPDEYELFPLKEDMLHDRANRSSRWNDSRWNPEQNLVPIERSKFSLEDFRSNPSVVVVDPRVIEFLSKDSKRLFTLSPRQFEELVAELMHRLGYSVQLGQLERDGGVDVFAERPSEIGDELVLIQCKHFASIAKLENR